ncbi:iron-sulfur cluster assembly 1 homolog, mitochondrial isoform X1 [Trichechus manatus latirostris]|uniref:Iron-sulfur cluster assembly 1 homolog, mitochondrial isoform X1 n=1 Tax=Trichechus manatus latirostris TaxID=127582 RepID=A0A2Y9RI18_TRIMA|nr:iron-sulfur cluster assembly 1 homolog, mitochondrial isoform X1 [Trichechus manatus latirostris]
MKKLFKMCVCVSDQDLDEACMVRTVKTGSAEKLVPAEHLVPAFLKGDLSYIKIFLGTYRTYATTQQVLDLLFQRYGCNFPYSARAGRPQDQLKGPEPRPVPVVKVAQDISLPQELAPGTSHGVHSAPAPALELHSTPPITSPAPAPAPVGEHAGGVDSQPGSPPEPAPGPLADVDPAPAPTPELHRAPAIPSTAPALASEEPAGESDT